MFWFLPALYLAIYGGILRGLENWQRLLGMLPTAAFFCVLVNMQSLPEDWWLPHALMACLFLACVLALGTSAACRPRHLIGLGVFLLVLPVEPGRRESF